MVSAMQELESEGCQSEQRSMRESGSWSPPTVYVLSVARGTQALDNPNNCQPGEAATPFPAKTGSGGESLVCPSQQDVTDNLAGVAILIGGS